jgi:hypothetical protein
VPKDNDSTLTCEIKDRIKLDLESRNVANGDVDILPDKCSFLDPRFKDRFSITDEPVKAVLEEIDTSVSLTQCHQTEVRNSTSDCDKEPPGKKGKFSSVFLIQVH